MLKLGLVILLLCSVTTKCQNLTSVTQYSGDILPSFLSLLTDIFPDYLNNTYLINLAVNTAMITTDVVFDTYIPPPEVPTVAEDTLWGEDDVEGDTSIRTFNVSFNPDRLTKLVQKLNDREIFTKPLEGALFNYGVNTDDLTNVIDRWLNNYDFDARQERLNQFPQYITNIQGLDIQYIHIKPTDTTKTVVPLVLLHGAPLTSFEYIYVIPYLTQACDDRDYVFEIIAPTLPGFAYSQGTSKIGLNTYQIAIIFKNLLQRIGFDQFYVHAGDFGQFVAQDMAVLFPDNVLGIHSNFAFSLMPKTLTKYVLASFYPPAVVEEQYISRLYPLSTRLYAYMIRGGYFHEQGTKPDTRATAMHDSPSGLCGWLVESFSTVNQTYNVENGTLSSIYGTFDIDDILDHATMHWDAESVTTWFRIYAEFSAWFQDPNQWRIIRSPTQVPMAAFKALTELIYQPDDWIADKFPNLVYSRTVDVGSHFFAYQHPEVMATSIWDGMDALIEFNASK